MYFDGSHEKLGASTTAQNIFLCLIPYATVSSHTHRISFSGSASDFLFGSVPRAYSARSVVPRDLYCPTDPHYSATTYQNIHNSPPLKASTPTGA